MLGFILASFTVTLDPDVIWSGYGLIIFIISVIFGTFVGNLPSNEEVHPFRTTARWVVWFLDLLWVIGLIGRGIHLF
ncbi:hypothetical protein COV06_01705 [Candidatus Uhrbacteria bacterium CG10_big_fil_rev_8_21_14_0_10_50_16]|uniref:Uncharacterized protein n=1 Tax=Candidatus Uhrbacteria bacterium CG10_big_fil_rev_8_21_14_0_10_50_16 TaxID=1975039 RepID=A0A2H0RMB7_9BACT|nr:MAG: hypothetical protein COV06_01705 [Candidatus Uhrbacteria bacterium CG10_big_fil_rev_8_21_14_0_10_50_16]